MTYREYTIFVSENIRRFEIEQKLEWQRTASVLCLLANINRDSKKRPRAYEIDDFMPESMREKKKQQNMTPQAMYEALKLATIRAGGEVIE